LINNEEATSRKEGNEKFWTKSSGKYFGKAEQLKSTNGRGGKHMARRMKKGRKHTRRGRKSKKG
jgi:hypothetical protein